MASAVVAVLPAAGHASAAPPSPARLATLVHQVHSAGTWDQQRAAFEALPPVERSAVMRVLLSPVPGPTKVTVQRYQRADLRYPCPAPQADDCDMVPPGPKDPGGSTGKPPQTSPCLHVTNSVTYQGLLKIKGDDLFTYNADLDYCYTPGHPEGPLYDYKSYSYASNIFFPWTTDPGKYIDRCVGQPSVHTLDIHDHHTGWFEASGKVEGVEVHGNAAPNLDSSVISDGTYAESHK